MKPELIKALHRRIASTSIGASTARGMGPGGTVAAARSFLADLSLARFRCRSASSFQRTLDRVTDEYVEELPRGAQHWGSARKFLNIFLRHVVYSRYLCEEYRLAHIVPWLEVPLDSHVALGLRGERGGSSLPRWHTVIGLDAATSRRYQDFAAEVASRMGCERVHLDLLYWRREQNGESGQRHARQRRCQRHPRPDGIPTARDFRSSLSRRPRTAIGRENL